MSIPNPWGFVFDQWGQDFFLHTSGTSMNWGLPVSVKPTFGSKTPSTPDLIPSAHKVRPTSGLEVVSSRHFPDEVQGDIILANAIGFLGIKQHKIEDDSTGWKTSFRQDLLVSKDGNFRPVDLEFAPDGSLYVIDWHNVLIGHMQHNARDPLRDHVHGRIYRITYPSRPLVKPVQVEGAPVAALLENLKEPELRVRYRTRRELRSHPASEVIPAVKAWAAKQTDVHAKVEALWVTWGMNQVDDGLLREMLASPDFHARAAAVRVLRYNHHVIADHAALLEKAAADEHGRVRLEAAVAASWLPNVAAAKKIVEVAGSKPLDVWSQGAVIATANTKPETLNHKSEFINHKPETLNVTHIHRLPQRSNFILRYRYKLVGYISFIPSFYNSCHNGGVVQFLFIIQFVPAGYTCSMIMPKVLVAFVDGMNNIPFINLHVVNIVQQLKVFGPQPFTQFNTPCTFVGHIIFVVHLAVEEFHLDDNTFFFRKAHYFFQSFHTIFKPGFIIHAFAVAAKANQVFISSF
jgi:hypothetical protein